MDEKMAANALNQDSAFQAAEAALRQGLFQVSSGVITPNSVFVAGCTAGTGLCLPATNGVPPVWSTIFPLGQVAQSANAQTYTGTALVGVANQPQYIIEILDTIPPDVGFSVAKCGTSANCYKRQPYRITARGWGLAPEAQATTQATYMYF
jgi:type IV pilus assembly protein PilX